MGSVIGVFSGKGGVGKTTLVANLAASLTKNFNKKVVIVDSNFSTSHLGLHFGLYEDPKVTLKEVIAKGATPATAFYIHPLTGVRVIPAPLKSGYDDATLKGFANVISQLKQDNDVVILDAAPGLGREVITAVKSIDEALIVVTPDMPSVTDALKTVNLIKKVDKKINILGVVLNRVKNEKYELTRKEIESACNVESISVIPEDGKIPESIAKGIPVTEFHPNSESSISFNRLSAALIGQSYEPRNFGYRLKKMLGMTKEEIVKMPSRKKEDILESKKGGQGTFESKAHAKKLRKISKSDIGVRLNMKVRQKLRERGIE